MFLCDTHADTLYAMQDQQRDPSLGLDITKERLLTGDFTRVQVLALFTGRYGLQKTDAGLTERELEQWEKLKAQGFHAIDSLDQAVKGQCNIMLSVEGGEVFHGGVERVDFFRDLGVRLAALVWNNENQLAYPACGGTSNGLTEYGRQVVVRMNQRHMAADVSHLNEAGFWDLLRVSQTPPMASHSCARALCDHPRNLTDEQLRALFAAGGFVGVNFYPTFLDASGTATLDTVVRHMEHMLSLGGEGHVGLGSDFDGIDTYPEGLRHAGEVPALLDAMRAHGFSESTVRDVAGESFRRYLDRI
ncbi:MAG: membrane dipeptidase [Clostridia bacterium]|nr:membrane dipeptidase [Clostridia bacterium]